MYKSRERERERERLIPNIGISICPKNFVSVTTYDSSDFVCLNFKFRDILREMIGKFLALMQKEGGELYSCCFMHVQLNYFSDEEETLKL